jgi:hypothetical protein
VQNELIGKGKEKARGSPVRAGREQHSVLYGVRADGQRPKRRCHGRLAARLGAVGVRHSLEMNGPQPCYGLETSLPCRWGSENGTSETPATLS